MSSTALRILEIKEARKGKRSWKNRFLPKKGLMGSVKTLSWVPSRRMGGRELLVSIFSPRITVPIQAGGGNLEVGGSDSSVLLVASQVALSF